MALSKRHVIPVDLPEPLIAAIKTEAQGNGFKTSAYIRHILFMHVKGLQEGKRKPKKA